MNIDTGTILETLPALFAVFGAWTIINAKVGKHDVRIKALEDNQNYSRDTINKIFDKLDKIQEDISHLMVELQKKQNIE
jgi:hypothetical protein